MWMKVLKQTKGSLSSTHTGEFGWGETSSKFTAGVKAYSINIDTHTSCLTASLDWPPLLTGLCRVCPENGLRIAWLQPPPAPPMWPVCQQQQRTDTHSLWRYELSEHSGGSVWDWCKLSHRQKYILSDILTLAAFSVDTLDSLEACFGLVCLHTHLYVHACSRLQMCAHSDMSTNIFLAILYSLLAICAQEYKVHPHSSLSNCLLWPNIQSRLTDDELNAGVASPSILNLS